MDPSPHGEVDRIARTAALVELWDSHWERLLLAAAESPNAATALPICSCTHCEAARMRSHGALTCTSWTSREAAIRRRSEKVLSRCWSSFAGAALRSNSAQPYDLDIAFLDRLPPLVHYHPSFARLEFGRERHPLSQAISSHRTRQVRATHHTETPRVRTRAAGSPGGQGRITVQNHTITRTHLSTSKPQPGIARRIARWITSIALCTALSGGFAPVSVSARADTGSYGPGHSYVRYNADHIPYADGVIEEVASTTTGPDGHVYDLYGNQIVYNADGTISDATARLWASCIKFSRIQSYVNPVRDRPS